MRILTSILETTIFTVILASLNAYKQNFNIISLIYLIETHKQPRKAFWLHCSSLFCLFAGVEDQLVHQKQNITSQRVGQFIMDRWVEQHALILV